MFCKIRVVFIFILLQISPNSFALKSSSDNFNSIEDSTDNNIEGNSGKHLSREDESGPDMRYLLNDGTEQINQTDRYTRGYQEEQETSNESEQKLKYRKLPGLEYQYSPPRQNSQYGGDSNYRYRKFRNNKGIFVRNPWWKKTYGWMHRAECSAYALKNQKRYICNTKGEIICLSGWRGHMCRIPICPNNNCGQNGICLEPGVCRCQLGYDGDHCEECIRLPGCKHGTCHKSYECNCKEGWKGTFCDEAICRPGCNTQHASCHYPGDCQCHPGMQGDNCDQCILAPGCVHGTCELPFQCLCKPGWSGDFCDRPTCTVQCVRGECTAPDTCSCDVGWTGAGCSDCVPYPGCVHGTCSKPWQCQCSLGWYGKLCNETVPYYQHNNYQPNNEPTYKPSIDSHYQRNNVTYRNANTAKSHNKTVNPYDMYVDYDPKNYDLVYNPSGSANGTHNPSHGSYEIENKPEKYERPENEGHYDGGPNYDWMYVTNENTHPGPHGYHNYDTMYVDNYYQGGPYWADHAWSDLVPGVTTHSAVSNEQPSGYNSVETGKYVTPQVGILNGKHDLHHSGEEEEEEDGNWDSTEHTDDDYQYSDYYMDNPYTVPYPNGQGNSQLDRVGYGSNTPPLLHPEVNKLWGTLDDLDSYFPPVISSAATPVKKQTEYQANSNNSIQSATNLPSGYKPPGGGTDSGTTASSSVVHAYP